jgi:hypothetical protein
MVYAQKDEEGVVDDVVIVVHCHPVNPLTAAQIFMKSLSDVYPVKEKKNYME